MSEIKINLSAPETEFSGAYVQGMADRMSVSHFKYGPVAEAYPEKVDAIKSSLQRLAKYIGTKLLAEMVSELKPERGDGNPEWLMDDSNFKMIEFMHPRYAKRRFRATTERESPGRVWTDGEVSARANDLTPQ